ncbi:hypothetical protein HKI87_02g10050 [Chloropicon roscoffensis]|uniref:Transcription initiation factor TFIID subunit 10 n=1 Tax=Chloropicon roscoffensis TaxID=1461544 RepID=A0AAX4P118_9CHLO
MAKGAEDWVREAREVKDAMREHSPAVPVELVEYYAKKQGLSIKDPHVAKLIAVSAEEFLGRVLRDAFEMTEKMDEAKEKDGPGGQEVTLHLDVLAKALRDAGINISGNQYL